VKARLYINGKRSGEAELTMRDAGGPKDGVGAGDSVTLIVFGEHSAPDAKKLFLHGKLETA
jgi:hypothetical protein